MRWLRMNMPDASLQDGMQERWPEPTMAKLVDAAVCTARAKAVFTFDAHGVSGHVNHVATHRGVLTWLRAHQGDVACWLLVRTFVRDSAFVLG